MGATYVPYPKISTPSPKPHKNVLMLLGIVSLLLVCALKWRDVIEYVNGQPQLTAKRQQQLDKKLSELDEAEQYALVATTEGMFPCLHSGHALYYLHIGEIWKYGITVKGERGRYTAQFLQDNGVSYIIQFKGTVAECLKEEQRKLFAYPLLPENLARVEEYRLLRPPYNPVLR